uniref:hypothetical protein n=1 Tax=Gelidibacter sp. TaxID=2018083 RepID=UPI00404B4DCB
MNIEITIIGAILVALCALPFFYFGFGRKIKEKKTLQALKDFANQHQSTISSYEVSGELIIGLDETSKTLFMSKHFEGQVTNKVLQLTDVTGCSVEKHYKNYGTQQVVERLGIRFVTKKANDVYWELFNSNETYQMSGELQLADAWVSRIKSQLQPQKQAYKEAV